MDYSDSNVGAAKEILKGRAEVKRGSTYEIPYRTPSMAICLCLDVLERIDDDTRAVSAIARVLKPCGILVAGVPATYDWPQYGNLIGPFRQYTRHSLEDLLQITAFAGCGLSSQLSKLAPRLFETLLLGTFLIDDPRPPNGSTKCTPL